MFNGIVHIHLLGYKSEQFLHQEGKGIKTVVNFSSKSVENVSQTFTKRVQSSQKRS